MTHSIGTNENISKLLLDKGGDSKKKVRNQHFKNCIRDPTNKLSDS